MAWIDTHCHLSYPGVGLAALERAAAAGVTRVVTIGTDLAHSRAAIEAAAAARADGYEVWATVGLHPHEASAGLAVVDKLGGLAREPNVAAVGECGLDYYYEHSPRDAQREVFAAQVLLARSTGLTLVVHTRDAWDDTIEVLRAVGIPERTIVHCFSGGVEEARRCLDLGAWLSFSGIVTFKNARDVRDAAVLCPLDRLLVETDAPFLAPVPHRGETNEPAWVALVGEAIAAARGVAVEEVEAATWANAEAVFGLA